MAFTNGSAPPDYFVTAWEFVIAPDCDTPGIFARVALFIVLVRMLLAHTTSRWSRDVAVPGDAARRAAVRARYTDRKIEALGRVKDPLADKAIEALAEAGLIKEFGQFNVLALVRAADLPACREFVEKTSTVPDWVDFDRLERGRRLMQRFIAATVFFGFPALVHTYSLADAHILVATGRLVHSPFKRLLETASFVAHVVGPGALRPGSKGVDALLRVRLLHARVRRMLMLKGHDVATLGVPVKRLSMINTALMFSYDIARQSTIMHFCFGRDGLDEYQSLWRYAAYLSGCGDALYDTYAENEELFKLLDRHDYDPSDDTRILYRAAVTDIASGSKRLKFANKITGGYLLNSESFLVSYYAFVGDTRLVSYVGAVAYWPWTLFFSFLSVVYAVLSTACIAVPPFGRLNDWFSETVISPLIHTTLDTPALFDDPGTADYHRHYSHGAKRHL